MSAVDKALKLIKDEEVEYVDIRFTDPRGKMQHVSFHKGMVDQAFFEDGQMFDGSSVAGWKAINESDMLLMPDTSSAIIDPFFQQTTLAVMCDVLDPITGQAYNRDPRMTAKKAEAYVKSSGVGDTVFFGPEAEFFIFDAVEWSVDMSGVYSKIISEEAAWSTAEKFEGGNVGHRPRVKGGYFPVSPVDHYADLRDAMSTELTNAGLSITASDFGDGRIGLSSAADFWLADIAQTNANDLGFATGGNSFAEYEISLPAADYADFDAQVDVLLEGKASHDGAADYMMTLFTKVLSP